MKRIFALLLFTVSGILFFCCQTARCAEGSSGFGVIIDIPEIQLNDEPPRARMLSNQSPEAHFHVVIQNISSQPLVLGRGNGQIMDLYFEITDENGKTTIVRQMHPAYAAYISDNVRIAPGQASVADIYYVRGAEPYPFPFPTNRQSQTVTIRAILETKPFKGATKRGIWTGRAVSEPCKVVLENNAS